jgi:hypothetical protein
MCMMFYRSRSVSSPASQLHLLQHGPRCASVLGAEDAQLQAAAVQQQQMQRMAQGNTGKVSVKGGG